MEQLGTIEQFGRLKLNDLRRSTSDNKLVDKKNVRNARLNSSRHLSISRTDKLTSRKHKNSNSNLLNSQTGMRRVSSVSAIHNGSITNNDRINSSVPNNGLRSRSDYERINSSLPNGVRSGARIDFELGGGGSEDSEEEEERSLRIREWLLGLEFVEPPEEPVIEYEDDPPQTDTALHIVYQES